MRKLSVVLLLVGIIFAFVVSSVVVMASLDNQTTAEEVTKEKPASVETDAQAMSEVSSPAASPQKDEPTFLSGPAKGDALEIALKYLQQNKELLGLSAEDLADYVVTDRYVSSHTGVTHIYLQQRYNSINVYNAIININIAADGSVINVGNRFIANLSQHIDQSQDAASAISAIEAAEFAAQNLNLKQAERLEIEQTVGGTANEVLLSDGGMALESIPAKLMYQVLSDGSVRLAWDLAIYELDAQNYWSVRIDAETGKLLDKANWVAHDDWGTRYNGEKIPTQTLNEVGPVEGYQIPELNALLAPDEYFVYPPPIESPIHVIPPDPPLTAENRSLEIDPATANASPYGWHDTDGVDGAEYTISRGNNVHAYQDTNGSNSSSGDEPDGGSSLVFSFTLDLTQHPSTYQEAAVTNLFYWNNIVHDVWYNYGFDEASGNFQATNYFTNTSGEGDWVFAEAQDGSGTCNANFGTPADGSNPRMQMYICGNTTPVRDGDLDNNVVVHEYGHGVSNRLTGGPNNVGCLNNSEQMGEGWSDWMSIVMTIEPGDTGPDARGMGTYLFGESSTGPGIRPAPYSTDMSVNNYTYGDVGGLVIPHGVGFLWSTMLWEMNWNLIGEYGFDPDLYNGTGGNNLAMQLVMDGMKLQPCSPGFVDGRDGILAADQVLTGGQNQCLIWQAFAKRGLGFSADQGSSTSTSDGTEAFDLPLGCLAVIEGTVTDSATTDPIEFAFVEAGSNSTNTDVDGFYQLGVLSGTYTMDFSAFGYANESVPNVLAQSGVTVTVDVDLDPVPSYLVEGFLTDSATGWPLYGSINVTGDPISPPPGMNEIWSDPVTGYYSASLPGGITYTFEAMAWVPGYIPEQRTVGPLTGDIAEDFKLDADAATCNAPGYSRLAATLLITEDFTTGIPTDTWTVVDNSNGSGCPWVDNDPGNRGNNTGGAGIFAIVDTDFCGSGTNSNTELQSPVLNLTNYFGVIVEYKTDYRDLSSTANVDVYDGTAWQNVQALGGSSVTGPSTQQIITTAGAGMANAQVRWHYIGGWDWWWKVDDVALYGLGECLPSPGGLVVGNVYDFNTSLGVNDATVTNDDGESAMSMSTPSDNATDEGFYTIFSSAGTHTFTATANLYLDDIQTPTVVQSDTVRQDFYLPAGFLVADPLSLEATLELGTSQTQTFTLTNIGAADADYELVENPSLTWLSEDPTIATVPVAASDFITITFDASVPEVPQPGVYTGELVIETNTPASPPNVPVSMTVTPPATWGQVEGHITGLGHCDVNPEMLETELFIEGQSGFTATVTSDASGYYSYWLDSLDNTYTVTVGYPGYLTSTTNLDITAQATVTLDMDLTLNAACFEANPTSFDVTLELGETATETLDLTNSSVVDGLFEFGETEGDFVPMLRQHVSVTSNGLNGTITWLSRNTEGIQVERADSGATIAYPASYLYTPANPSKLGQTSNILVYTDDWIHTTPNTLVQQSLSNLGLAATVHIDGDYTGFEAALTGGGPWDLVIWSGENFIPPQSTLDALLAYVQGGGKLGATYWRQLDLPTDPLWTEMGFTYSNNYVPPQPTYWWQPNHRLFNSPEDAPEWINRVQNSGTSQGTELEPLANGIALAGYTTTPSTNEAAIVLREDGMTIYKGMRDVSTNADDDADTILDGTELWENIMMGLLEGFGGVDWLDEDPITGTVSALSSSSVDIIFTTPTTTVNQPGTYHATLSLSTNEPTSPPDMPVTMTVTPPATWGKVEGHITGLGHCDVNPEMLETELFIEGQSGFTATVASDASGYYSYWLDSLDNTYTVTVGYPGYLTSTTNLDITAQATVTLDIDLTLNAACFEANPTSFDVTLELGETATETLDLTNSSVVDGLFEFGETEGNFVPLFTLKAPSVTLPAYERTDASTVESFAGPLTIARESSAYQPSSAGLQRMAGDISVLLFVADTAGTLQASLQAYPDLTVVDYYDARNGTPTLAEFLAYDVVFVGSNNGFNDNVAAGDVLADYIDAGGKVIQTNGSFNGTDLLGRFLTDGYSPYDYSSTLFLTTVNLGTVYEPNHPIMAGVTNVTDNLLHNELVPAVDATPIADWDDGEGLAAVKGNVVALNMFVSDSGSWGGDTELMIHNTIIWLTASGVDWLDEDPITGTVSALSSSSVDIIFTTPTTTVVQPGTYHATLSLSTNEPTSPPDMPVTMTVTPPPTWGKVEGFITGLGYCDVNPEVFEADIVFEGSGSFSTTITADASGYYSYWLDSDENNYTVNVGYPGYVTSTTSLSIVAQDTVTHNVDLTLNAACLTVDPQELHILVPDGMSVTVPLTLTNSGVISTDFTISEYGWDYNLSSLKVAEPLAVTLPAYERTDASTVESFAGPLTIVRESSAYQPSSAGLQRMAGDISVLLFVADTAGTLQASLQAYPDLTVVDYYDARNGTPTLAEFLAYDVVFVGSNNGFNDNVAAGDVLADYIDAGGKVIQTNGSFNGTQGWALLGRFLTDGYSPYDYSSNLFFTTVNLGTVYEPNHPIMAGVANVTDNLLHNELVPAVDATPIADWDDGEGLAAVKGNVVALNMFVSDSGDWGGDTELMIYNTIVWLAFEDVPWLFEDPVTGTLTVPSTKVSLITCDSTITVTDLFTNGLTPGDYYAGLDISGNNLPENADIPVTCSVLAPYDVDITPEDSMSSPSGTTVTYTLMVTNRGTLADSYDVTVSGNSWATTANPTSMAVDPYLGTAMLTVTVDIPAGVPEGTMDVATVTVTSVNSPTVSASGILTTTAENVYDVSLNTHNHSMEGQAGDTMLYTLWVMNMGTTTDTFTLWSEGTWINGTTPASVTVGMNMTATLHVTVEIPITATSAHNHTTWARAMSWGDNSVMHGIPLTTTVNNAPWAVDDWDWTGQNYAIEIDVLANDHDIDGDTLSIADVGTPDNGGTALMSSGVISYTPALDFIGMEVFTYTASDGSLEDTAMVTVTVMAPPVGGIALTKTVSTDGTCGNTDTITVNGSTDITYCYTVENTGEITLSIHTLEDDQLGTLMSDFAMDLAPGESTSVMTTTTIDVDTHNVATWTASYMGDMGTFGFLNVTAVATDSAWVTVETTEPVTPSITLAKTVGTSASTCATADTITVAEGTVVYYCYQVTNTGNITLDLHTLVDDHLGTILPGISVALAPGESTDTVANGIVVSSTINVTTTNVATWTAEVDGTSTSAMATAAATVNIIPAGSEVYGVVVAAPTDAMSGNVGTSVTYTVWVTNTGNVADTFDMAITANTWTSTPSVSSLSLNAGESGTVQVTVDIPATANNNDTDIASVAATSQSDATKTDSVQLTTTAINTGGETFGVDLSGNDATFGQGGTTVTYTVKITNTGTTTDTFDLTKSGDTWTTSLSTASVTLASGEMTEFMVEVTLPANVNSSNTDTVTVTATSQSNATVTDTTELTTSGPPTIYLPVVLKTYSAS